MKFLTNVLFFGLLTGVHAAPDVLIADFEGDTYLDWKTTGLAFGKAPAQGTLVRQNPVSGFKGKGLVNTYLGGDESTGSLTSPAFEIERKWINFLIAGGGYPKKTCINLLVDKRVVRTAVGPRPESEALSDASWNVEELVGKTAVIQIVDFHTGGWGHINIDHIVMSDSPTREVIEAPPPAVATPKPTRSFGAGHAKQMREGLELFDTTVASILKDSCVECHGGKKVKGDLDLATRAGLLKGGSQGPTVILGHGADSFLYKVTARIEEPFMPDRGDPLRTDQVEALRKWIDLGAPYSQPLVDDPREVVDLATVTKEDKEFWSFLPLREDFGGKDSIDEFITARLEEKGLSLSKQADKTTLLTRVSLDLTGLPPTAEALKDFLADDSPEAWTTVVDRLLASPHYGERWARHWMDLARYADSGGFENDNDRQFAWPYRDYLIEAFNRNQPYDEFVHWQLAGDELEPDNHLAWQATGFLASGVKNGQLTEREAEPERYDVIDDWVNTTGNAFLGLSLGCARCHDHKFDPIPAADYYAMASVFATSTRRFENVKLPMDDTHRSALAKHEAEIEKARADLLAHEKTLLSAAEIEKEDADEKRGGWVFLEPNFAEGLGNPSTENPDPMHRTEMVVEEVGKGTFQATYINGGHAGLRLSFISPLHDIRGVSIELLPDLENPKAGLGMSTKGDFRMRGIGVLASAIKDGVPSPSRGLPLTRADATIHADHVKRHKGNGLTFGGQERQAIFLGWDALPEAEGYRFTVRIPCNYESPEGRPSIGKVRLKFLHGVDTRPLLEPAVDVADLVAGRSGEEQSDAARLATIAIDDTEWLRLAGDLEKRLDAIPPIAFQTTLVVTEGKTPAHWKTQSINFWKDIHVLRRGSTANKTGLASPGFLQVVSVGDAAHRFENWETESRNPKTSGRRTALARWITDEETGGGRLAARVMVNRVWQHHFGRGLVASSSDFGVQGTGPSHPELLDWLARRFLDSEWDVKALHRLILSSAAWQQATTRRGEAAKVDPSNQFLWRHSQRRLEAEVVRDRMLQVSGLLDSTMYGKGTLDEGMLRRSIYFEIKRSALIPMMVQLNWPDTLASLDRRPVTTVAPQALLMMNHPQVRRYSEAFAKRILADKPDGAAAKIERAYELALLRKPTGPELKAAEQFLNQQEASYSEASDKQAGTTALADFCQALFSLNEFHFTL